MIATVRKLRETTSSDCREQFLALLSPIKEQARFAFRDQPFDRRQELVAEVIANAFVAFTRLVRRGLSDVVYATPLAQYAIKQVRGGRRVGTKLNVRDVSSEYAQREKGITVERLDRFDEENGEWREVWMEERKAGPADTAAARLDIADWFATLPKQKRRVAETLARGETTKATARKFKVSAGRISQLRREFERGWEEFQGEAGLI
jgi:hypothetical protein